MKVLIVDDNPDLVQALSVGFELQWEDCQVVGAADGEQALAAFRVENPDIILLDVTMPKMGGFDVLRRVREVSDVPVIMLTVKSEEIEKVRALELGADDYVTKPFGSLELMARVRAVLRRAAVPVSGTSVAPLVCGDLTIAYGSGLAEVKGQQVRLTPTEYRLLCALARQPNQVVTHQALLVKVWGHEYRSETDFLKVYVKRLRDKIEEDPSNPRYILTVWGQGYKLAVP